VQKVKDFFEELLVHTKGSWARRPFILDDWQLDRVVSPLFGDVIWSGEWSCYVRKNQILWLFVARKNGKSELLAGIALYLLCADGEEGAEIYGAAKDRDQARKVFDVAVRMVELSPQLDSQLTIVKHVKRIVHPASGSVYEVVAADAAGNLGHNPHGVIFDEIVAQPNRELWDAFRTALGSARRQPMMVAATTAGPVNTGSFAHHEHLQMRKVNATPSLEPHVLTVIFENDPKDDWQDEINWKKSNPALGSFLSLQSLRNEKLEAMTDPTKINAFMAFHMNIWTQQITRCLDMTVWDSCNIAPINESDLHGCWCYGGLDLSATSDLTALAWYFPGSDEPDTIIWRVWIPAAKVDKLNELTSGEFQQWINADLVTVMDGEVIDYDLIMRQIEKDATDFDVVEIALDKWNATHILTKLNEQDITAYEVPQNMAGMSPATKELLRRVEDGQINHGGNPVARWNADALEVKQDMDENIRPVKPDRLSSNARIDLMVAAILTIAADLRPKEGDDGVVNAWSVG
jgi:phage terminase large subunit-like protein